jgi:hypothetical protein
MRIPLGAPSNESTKHIWQSFYVLMVTGREDILMNSWSAVYNPKTGKIWKNELWKALKDTYTTCPEYG